MTKTRTFKAAPARKPTKGGARKRPTAKAAKADAAKPRSAKMGKAPKAIRHKLVWRGVLIAMEYKPKGCGFFAHLEVRVVAPVGAPIPVTETGYLSHHVYPALIGYAGGPVPYLRKWLDREAGSLSYRRALDRWRQLDLFAALEK